MRKINALCAFALFAFCTSSFAQKLNFQDTQARSVNTYAHSYVKPLIVELEVKAVTPKVANVKRDETGQSMRVVGKYRLTKTEAETAFKGVLDNIRSWAVYKLAEDLNVDAIVAATFNIYSEDNGYIVEIKGFPANFKNWNTATEKDYEWIKMESTMTTFDLQSGAAAAAIKTEQR